MPHKEIIHKDILRWPLENSYSAGELQRGLIDAENEYVQRSRALADAQARVAERDRQLIELKHRFSNSLQVLISSLKMDCRRAVHQEAKAVLDAAATRTFAIAHLHQQLAAHEKDTRLDLYRFLNDLASELEKGTSLRCNVDGESIHVNGDIGFRLATVVTELVLNARKHAYDGIDGGIVRISCHRLGANRLRLSVSDGGKGLPKNFNPEETSGIGMSLIVATAKQLNGELNIRNADGASFTLLVPIEQMP